MSWIIDLPITKPLSLNDREHWAVKAKRTREVREHVAHVARAAGIPQLNRPRVTLHYSPRDKRRREIDAINWRLDMEQDRRQSSSNVHVLTTWERNAKWQKARRRAGGAK